MTKQYHILLFIILSLTIGSYSPAIGQYRIKPFDISKTITCLENTEDGYLIYGTDSGEIGSYDGVLFNRFDQLDSRINDISSTINPHYLTEKGLYHKSNGSKKLISPNNLNILDKSDDNNLLITTTGIYRKSGSDYLPYGEEFYSLNSVTNGEYFKLGKVEYLRLDRKVFQKDKSWREYILHPHSDFSLVKYDDSKMIIADSSSIVSFDNRGVVDTLYQLDSIGLSKMWMIDDYELLFCADGNVGVFNVRKKELKDIYEIDTDKISAVTVDNWDNIWITAGSFLYQIIDTGGADHKKPPQLKIESVNVNGKAQSIGQSIRLEKGNNDLEIGYHGVQLTSPQELEYQTKLSRTDNSSYEGSLPGLNQWSEPSKNREAEYRNIPAGQYKFELRATVDGQYFTFAKSLKIRVPDDTIQKIWLVGLLGGLGVLISALFFNTRYNRLKEKSAQERKLLIQKNKMLTLQQKALQLQMNPHFVFNALNSIQGLIAKEDNKNARRYLQQFSAMMRSVLNQSREETIQLEEEIAYLKSYLSLEQMANNSSFDYEVTLDDRVEDGISIPTMIIQPFVENAIIHGVKGLSERSGMIHVHFQQSGNKITCVVEDNGVGRKEAGKNKASSHKSVALDVVRERLSSKHAKPISYEDIIGLDETVEGTRVSINITI